jgi:hypothetical protein
MALPSFGSLARASANQVANSAKGSSVTVVGWLWLVMAASYARARALSSGAPFIRRQANRA